MATTYTTNVGLSKPATGDTSWSTTLNTTIDAVDAVGPISGLAVRQKELPSTTLNVKVAAGKFISSTGAVVTYAGTSSQAMTTAATNYVYLNDGGTLTVNTTGYPANTWHVKLATVVAGASTITSVMDDRITCNVGGYDGNTIYLALAGGTLADAANIAVGSTAGTKIGTGASQKIGFWNATPVIQQAGASQAALTNSTGGAADGTISAVSGTGADSTINNNFTELHTLLNAIRSALVTTGIIKGSA